MNRILVILLVCVGGSLARAQSPSTSPQSPGSYEEPKSVPELLRENGGSLLRAGLGQQSDPSASQLDSMSFFSVPPPKPRVIQKHDLVTIIIREQSEFTSDGSAESTKNAQLAAQITQFIKLNLSNLELENAIGGTTPRIDMNGNRRFSGEGTVERSDSFTARITAEVIDVKPNGNLVLAARKRIVTDDEEQLFLMAGIARAQDITPDNTILSTQMYDLDLRRMNKGSIRAATERGVMPKLLDQLNLW